MKTNNELMAEYLEKKTVTPAGHILCIKPEKKGDPYYAYQPNNDMNQLIIIMEKIAQEMGPLFNLQIQSYTDQMSPAYSCCFGQTIHIGKTIHRAIANACIEYIKNKK